jgi:hypothetical protein
VKGGLQGQRFGVLLNRLFGLRETDMPVDISPEVLPVFNIAADVLDHYQPRGEHLWGAVDSAAAVVGEFSFIAIRNPARSQKCVVVIDAETQGASAAIALRLLRADQVLANETQLKARDSRDENLLGPCVSGDGSNATQSGSNFATVQFLQGVTKKIGAVLAPGSVLFFWGGATNVAIATFTISGYVRNCTPEEMRS